VRRYAEFPARVIDGAPPWSVWLGALAPTEGIWRVTRAGIWLSPVEGDAVAEYADDAVWHMLSTITGERGDYPTLEQVRFGQADPYCVRWETGEEPEPEPEFRGFRQPGYRAAGAPAGVLGLAEAGSARAAAEHR
jgi:hypothetical protein